MKLRTEGQNSKVRNLREANSFFGLRVLFFFEVNFLLGKRDISHKICHFSGVQLRGMKHIYSAGSHHPYIFPELSPTHQVEPHTH